MRVASALGLVALALAGCSKATPDQPSEQAASESRVRSGSDVAATAGPGVALTYAYRYRLPIERVVSSQEQHAAACEALGQARCRIVGMHYWAGAHRTISASLALRLAPPLARAFGKSATAAIAAAGGMLTEASIESVEAGQAAQRADATAASLSEDRQAAEQQLASGRGGGMERATLQGRVATLQDAARDAQQAGAEARSKLTETPLTIEYESGAVDPGFSDGPLLGALKDGWTNIVSGLAMIVLIVVTVAPWVLAVAILVGIWSRIRLPLRRLLGLEDGA